ncbi:MAG: hypothetical protein KGJ13_01945 [Patescibacteria group bacterium]|nr:hypothetical protein [Patescibacteria group bacterium]
MTTLVALLQAVFALLLTIQDNPGITSEQQQQAISAASQVVAAVQKSLSENPVSSPDSSSYSVGAGTHALYSNYSNEHTSPVDFNAPPEYTFSAPNNQENQPPSLPLTAVATSSFSNNVAAKTIASSSSELGSLRSAYANSNNGYSVGNPTVLNGYGVLVGPGITDSLSPSCNMQMLGKTTNEYPPGTPGFPTLDAMCREIGRIWLGSIDYTGQDGACYHTDWTGTYKMDCATFASVTGSVPPQLPYGGDTLPVRGENVNWSSYNAKCFLTSSGQFDYGFTEAYPCTSAVQMLYNITPPPQTALNSVPTSTSVNLTPSVTGAGIRFGQLVTLPFSAAVYNYELNQQNLPAGTVYLVAQGISGQYGLYYFSPTAMQAWDQLLPNTNHWESMQALPANVSEQMLSVSGVVPMNIKMLGNASWTTPCVTPLEMISQNCSSASWQGNNSAISTTQQPSIVAGGVVTSTLPAALSYLTSGQLNSLRSAYAGTNGNNPAPTILDEYGTLVGPGITDSLPETCNMDLIQANSSNVSNGIDFYGQPYGQFARPPVDVICRAISPSGQGRTWVASLDYADQGACYHTDWTGTYKIDCNILYAITGSVPPQLPGGTIPSIGMNVNWSAYNAKCYGTWGLTDGDKPDFFYGITNPATCTP